MIKLTKKGAPTKAERELRNKMNDHLDGMSSGDKQEFSNRKYTSMQDLEQAWSEMKNVESTSSEPVSSNVNDVNSSPTKEPEVSKYYEAESVSEPSSDIPDEFNDFEGFDEFDPDPNIGDTKSKGYNKIEYDPSVQTIPEPIFSQEIAGNDDPSNEGDYTSQPQATAPSHSPNPNQPQNNQPRPQPQQPVNPDLHDADEKTKRIAATLFVDRILKGYEALHEFAKPIAKLKDKKIADLERKGLIDPTHKIIVNAKGHEATLREIVEKTNEGIDETLTPDPTFNSTVRPPMIREFTKRGLGLTDMQEILLAFGQDIGMKAFQIIAVRKNLGTIIDIFKEGQKDEKKAMANAQRNSNPVNPDSVSMPNQNQMAEEHIHQTEEV